MTKCLSSRSWPASNPSPPGPVAATAKAGFRRPDILLYINGLPLVFIELKNSNIKLRTAYDDNPTNAKADIP